MDAPLVQDPLGSTRRAVDDREPRTHRGVHFGAGCVAVIPVGEDHYFVKRRRRAYPVVYEWVCIADGHTGCRYADDHDDGAELGA